MSVPSRFEVATGPFIAVAALVAARQHSASSLSVVTYSPAAGCLVNGDMAMGSWNGFVRQFDRLPWHLLSPSNRSLVLASCPYHGVISSCMASVRGRQSSQDFPCICLKDPS